MNALYGLITAIMLTTYGDMPEALFINLWKTCGKPVDDCGKHTLSTPIQNYLDKL